MYGSSIPAVGAEGNLLLWHPSIQRKHIQREQAENHGFDSAATIFIVLKDILKAQAGSLGTEGMVIYFILH